MDVRVVDAAIANLSHGGVILLALYWSNGKEYKKNAILFPSLLLAEDGWGRLVWLSVQIGQYGSNCLMCDRSITY